VVDFFSGGRGCVGGRVELKEGDSDPEEVETLREQQERVMVTR